MRNLYDVADRLSPFARPYVIKRLKEEAIEYEKSGKRLEDLANAKKNQKWLWKEFFSLKLNPIEFSVGSLVNIVWQHINRKPSSPEYLPEDFLTWQMRQTTLVIASSWAEGLHHTLRDHDDHQLLLGIDLTPEWNKRLTQTFLRNINQLPINLDDAHAILEDFGASLRLANKTVRFPFCVILEPQDSNEKPFLAKLTPKES